MADSVIPTGIDTASRYGNYTTDFDPNINRWELLEQLKKEEAAKDKGSLSFTDMLSLMVAQFQYQSIDNQADTTDMMNQLVQMSSMQAMTEMTTQMKELVLANVMSYSASLVGQTVTIGVYDDEGKLHDFEGVVEGTGIYNGEQVIFVDGKSYSLSSIMAVGKLPPRVEDPENPDEGEDKDDNVDQVPGDGEDKDDNVDQVPGDGEDKDDNVDQVPDDKVDGGNTENEVG